mgnify:CR=1 FL=1
MVKSSSGIASRHQGCASVGLFLPGLTCDNMSRVGTCTTCQTNSGDTRVSVGAASGAFFGQLLVAQSHHLLQVCRGGLEDREPPSWFITRRHCLRKNTARRRPRLWDAFVSPSLSMCLEVVLASLYAMFIISRLVLIRQVLTTVILHRPANPVQRLKFPCTSVRSGWYLAG